MTVALHDHIHLFAYTGQTTITGTEHDNSRYKILMPGMEEKTDTAAQADYGLTGVAHVYQTLSGGAPRQYRNGTIQIMATTAEKDALKALSGKICWFMVNDHDDDSPIPVTNNGYRVLPKVTGARPINAFEDYWYVFVQIQDIPSA